MALDRTSVEEATRLTERLITQSPDDGSLQVAKALLLIRGRDRGAAITELRVITERHGNDPYVHQALAGQLGCDKATWPEAWEHWKIARQAGPLPTLSFKCAAYYLARRFEPARSSWTLSGSTSVERLVIRTRSLGFSRLLDAFFGLAVIAALIGSRALGVGVALGVVAMALGLWCAFVNYFIGCWKCFAVWVFASAVMWPLFVYALRVPAVGVFWLFAILLGVVFQISKAKGITLPHQRLSSQLERRSPQ